MYILRMYARYTTGYVTSSYNTQRFLRRSIEDKQLPDPPWSWRHVLSAETKPCKPSATWHIPNWFLLLKREDGCQRLSVFEDSSMFHSDRCPTDIAGYFIMVVGQFRCQVGFKPPPYGQFVFESRVRRPQGGGEKKRYTSSSSLFLMIFSDFPFKLLFRSSFRLPKFFLPMYNTISLL